MKKKYSILLKDFLESRILDENMSSEFEMALETIMDGDPDVFALTRFDELCYSTFEMLPCINEEKHLFHFVRFPVMPGETQWVASKCPILKDIKSNSVTLASPRRFNDPMDPLIKAWVERRKQHSDDKVDKRCYELIEKTIAKIYICSFVDPKQKKKIGSKRIPGIEDINPLMWAHYTDSHKGLCIQYKVKPSNCVDTNDQIVRLLDVNYSKKFPLNGNISLTDSFVAKAECWSYENETRLITYSRNNSEDFCTLQNFEIEAVYMGCRIEHEMRDSLKKALKGSSIRLYQMSFSEDDITQLVAHEIKN